jgi:hypothetical protein
LSDSRIYHWSETTHILSFPAKSAQIVETSCAVVWFFEVQPYLDTVTCTAYAVSDKLSRNKKQFLHNSSWQTIRRACWSVFVNVGVRCIAALRFYQKTIHWCCPRPFMTDVRSESLTVWENTRNIERSIPIISLNRMIPEKDKRRAHCSGNRGASVWDNERCIEWKLYLSWVFFTHKPEIDPDQNTLKELLLCRQHRFQFHSHPHSHDGVYCCYSYFSTLTSLFTETCIADICLWEQSIHRVSHKVHCFTR